MAAVLEEEKGFYEWLSSFSVGQAVFGHELYAEPTFTVAHRYKFLFHSYLVLALVFSYVWSLACRSFSGDSSGSWSRNKRAEPKQGYPSSMWSIYFGLDLRALAFLRMVTGLCVLWDLWNRLAILEFSLTDTGVFPRHLHLDQTDQWRVCLHLCSGQPVIQLSLCLIHAFLALCLVVGYFSRLSAFFTWLLTMSLHNRWLDFGGQETLLLQLLFWSCFLPTGFLYSLDSIAEKRKTRQKSKLDSTVVTSFATCALSIQISMLWFLSALEKTEGFWLQGVALYYAGGMSAIAKPLLLILLSRPYLHPFLCHASVWLEFLSPLALFCPFLQALPVIRSGYLVTMAAFHFMSHFFFAIDYYPALSITMSLLLLPPYFISAFEECLDQALRWVRQCFGWQNKQSSSLCQQPREKAGEDREGHDDPKTPWKGWTFLSRTLLPFLAFCYVLSVPLGPVAVPNGPLHILSQLLRLDQRWSMFGSPTPGATWPSIQGALEEGILLELTPFPAYYHRSVFRPLYHPQPPYRISQNVVDYAYYTDDAFLHSPQMHPDLFVPENHLYFKYWEKLQNLEDDWEREEMLQELGQWLCTHWNSPQGEGETQGTLVHLRFKQYYQKTLSPPSLFEGGPLRHDNITETWWADYVCDL